VEMASGVGLVLKLRRGVVVLTPVNLPSASAGTSSYLAEQSRKGLATRACVVSHERLREQ
jgi:hypothetical protein